MLSPIIRLTEKYTNNQKRNIQTENIKKRVAIRNTKIRVGKK